jgi:hypothetical protein
MAIMENPDLLGQGWPLSQSPALGLRRARLAALDSHPSIVIDGQPMALPPSAVPAKPAVYERQAPVVDLTYPDSATAFNELRVQAAGGGMQIVSRLIPFCGKSDNANTVPDPQVTPRLAVHGS